MVYKSKTQLSACLSLISYFPLYVCQITNHTLDYYIYVRKLKINALPCIHNETAVTRLLSYYIC